MTDPESRPSICVFFPVYNDEKTVRQVTEKSLATLAKIASHYSVVIVNDCSPDASGKIADQLAKEYPHVRVIHHPVNRGYGNALQTGFRHAGQVDWVCQLDGDDQYDVRELEGAVHLMAHHDLIVSYRPKKSYGRRRKFISYVYNKAVRFLFDVPVRDINSGFRMVRRALIDDLEITSQSPFVGAEIVVRTMLKDCRMIEIPIAMSPRLHGVSGIITVRNISATIREMLGFWWKVYVPRRRQTR